MRFKIWEKPVNKGSYCDKTQNKIINNLAGNIMQKYLSILEVLEVHEVPWPQGVLEKEYWMSL